MTMIVKIENEQLITEINSFGSELHSLKSKHTGVEYLWQGDPAVWSGRSPILFPIVGRLKGDSCRHEGKEYTLPKHGFARTMEFEKAGSSRDKAVFSLRSNGDTLAAFPFDFELTVTFVLKGYTIEVSHELINRSGSAMYFSIGAHPGFNCEIGDYLEFAEEETLSAEKIDEDAMVIDRRFPVLEHSRVIPITVDVFKADALILSGYQSNMVCLKSPQHNRELRFDFKEAPFLGLWAKPGAPYVCIEPWYGVNDSSSATGELAEKRGIQKLNASERFAFSWSAEVVEP